MKSVEEKDVVEALRKASSLAERAQELAKDMPPVHGRRLVQSTSSLVANLAMALDVLRKKSPDSPA
jgi:hypothetical protein